MTTQKSNSAITLAIVNEKGGVAKTTTTANLAVMLARLGSRVLAIDADPQGHLTFTLGYERNIIKRTLYDVLQKNTPLHDIVLPTFINPTNLAFFDPKDGEGPKNSQPVSGPDLVPINMQASAADGELREKMTWPTLLRKALKPLVSSYDYILIDTNPALGVLTINALCAAQAIIIPLVPEVLAVQGLGDLLQVVRQAQEEGLNSELVIAGVVFTKVQRYKGHHEIIASLRGELSEELGISCFKTEIRQSAVFTRAANRRSVVVLSDPYSDYAKDCWHLLAEVLEIAGGPALQPTRQVIQAIRADQGE